MPMDLRLSNFIAEQISSVILSLDLDLNITGWGSRIPHLDLEAVDDHLKEILPPPSFQKFDLCIQKMKHHLTAQQTLEFDHDVTFGSHGFRNFFVIKLFHQILVLDLDFLSQKILTDPMHTLEVIDNAPGMIFRFILTQEKSMTFTYVNEKSFDIFELPKATFQENPSIFMDFVIDEDLPELLRLMDKSAEKLSLFEWTGRVKTATNKLKWVKVTSLPYKGSKNETIWNGILIDISNEKKLEDELVEQKNIAYRTTKLAALGQLAASIGHEINNPLTILMAKMQILQSKIRQGHLDSNIIQQNMASQLNACTRIKGIAEGLRNFTYFERLSNGTGDIKLAVKNVLALVSDIYSLEGVNIIVDLKGEHFLVSCATDLLEQVILNLLSNAHDAVAEVENKDIRLSLTAMEREIELQVIDHGVGITAEDQPKIFDNFYTTKQNGKGTGLGLPITKSIIEASGGSIDCKSSKEDGTIFRVRIPLVL